MTAPTRPPEFDQRLVDHIPLLKKVARKCTRTLDERDDLVSDTIAYALSHWEKFRPDGSFYMWLTYMVRWIATEKVRSRVRRAKHMRQVDADITAVATPPSQLAAIEALEVYSSIPAGRDGDILRRRAMGDTLVEIGADLGIGKERARQIEHEQREVLRSHLGRAGSLAAVTAGAVRRAAA